MLIKPRYSFFDLLLWTRTEVLVFLLYAGVVASAYHVAGWTILQLPWAPVAVVGTAVAFMIGFQNNATYGRIWEARKIWGGIVNESRSFAMKVSDMVAKSETCDVDERGLEQERRLVVDRHIAWLTALRHGMRTPRPWEEFAKAKTNREWRDAIHIPELQKPIEEDLAPYLSPEELETVLAKTNRATALLFEQSHHLRRLKEAGALWEFGFLELENQLQLLFEFQGKSERIKNFPYPAQYAALNYYFVRIFAMLVPFATVPAFAEASANLSPQWMRPIFVWGAVPVSGLISWLFFTMERIGRVGDNPFEGTGNDVPISAIARGIEIDLRQMRGDDPSDIPPPFPTDKNVQM